jgi:hypothetical protein
MSRAPVAKAGQSELITSSLQEQRIDEEGEHDGEQGDRSTPTPAVRS